MKLRGDTGSHLVGISLKRVKSSSMSRICWVPSYSEAFSISATIGVYLPALPYLGRAFHGLNFCERAQLPNELYIWGILLAGCLLSPVVQSQLSGLILAWAPFQYPIRHLIKTSRKVSKPRDFVFRIVRSLDGPLSSSAVDVPVVSQRCTNLSFKPSGFDASRNVRMRRLLGYWNGAQVCALVFLVSRCHFVGEAEWAGAAAIFF